jgi:hypothetical protein
MAFLDNSGDILLDAVLTDTGRMRMAKNEFKIVKFALGDEEINYELFNKDHPSGSAFHDLKIMQTPVLEAFTNNTSTMNTKLVSISRTNILHMPILKLNTKTPSSSGLASDICADFPQGFVLTATNALETSDTKLKNTPGVLFGVNPAKTNTGIIVDQGLDSDGDPSRAMPLDIDLVENQYLVQLDHRLLRVVNPAGDPGIVESKSYVDDDYIAAYFFSIKHNAVSKLSPIPPNDDTGAAAVQVFNGPLGTRFQFRLAASLNIQESSALFNKLGPGSSTTLTINGAGGAVSSLQFMDTMVRVTGITTGISIDIPIRIVRK